MKRILLASMMLLALLTGCSKEKELHNQVSPDQYIKKSALAAQYSMYRGIDEADSTNAIYAIPGYSYDYGVVIPAITESALEFRSVMNFENNPTSYTVVASFPITKHFDIIKQQDDYGQQTNQLIVDEQRPWDQREYMRVDWTKPTKGAVTNQLWAMG